MELNLKNKVVLIAGSSKGIGLTIAKYFLDEEAKVIISGRNEDNLQFATKYLQENSKYKNFSCLQVDFTKEQEVENSISIANSMYGDIDIAIANVGSGVEPRGLNFTANSLQDSFEKNFLASVLLVKHVAPIMTKKNKGAIILISSIAGCEHISAPLAYSANKAALNMVTKKLSYELAIHNIRVNAIAPGNIFIPGGSWDKKLKQDELGVQQYIKNEVPLQKLGQADDVANLALFLASEKANFITGSLMVVDGGQTRTF